MIGQILGAAVGGLLGLSGQKSANKANAAMSREQMDWQSGESEIARNFNERMMNKNMSWQTQMENSAVRRRMKDLKAAGINPLLAGVSPAGSGNSAVASSPTPSGVSTHAQQNEMGAAINSAIDALNLSQMVQQTRKLRAEADITEAGVPAAKAKEHVKTDIYGKATELYDNAKKWLERTIDSKANSASGKGGLQKEAGEIARDAMRSLTNDEGYVDKHGNWHSGKSKSKRSSENSSKKGKNYIDKNGNLVIEVN